MCGFQEIQFIDKKQMHYVFTIYDWPFLLFEVLYEAIGASFDRTDIRLRFLVTKRLSDLDKMYWPSVEHKDISTLLED